MAFVIADRVREQTTTTGTGALSLNGAVSGFRSFVSAVGGGNNTYYVVSDGLSWEVGIGTVTSGAPNTLSRDTVLSNSLGDTTKVNFAAGTKDVALTLPASKTLVPEKPSEGRQALGLGTAAVLNFGTGADDLLKTSAADVRYAMIDGDAALDDLTVNSLKVNTGYGIAVGDVTPSQAISLYAVKAFAPDQSVFGQYNEAQISDAALTANRGHWGAHNKLLNRRTATDAYLTSGYGTYSVVMNGDDNGSADMADGYGAYNYLINQASSATNRTVAAGHGSYNWVRQHRTGEITTAYATYNRISRDDGTLVNAYGVYNLFEGTIGTKWGIYSNGDDKNYLTGSLGLGIAPTEKLHVSGNALVTGAVKIADGSAAAPVITFDSDTNTGMYRAGADQIGLSANGAMVAIINASSQYLAGTLGTAALPIFTFSADPNTGIYSPAADQLAITAGGTARATWNTSNQYLAGGLGSAALPALSFSADPNTGIYSPAADQLAVTAGGAVRTTWNTSNQYLAAGLGTAALPIFSFSGDPNTGIYSPAADQLAVTAGGSRAAEWSANGRMTLYAAGGNFVETDNSSAFEIQCATGEANLTFHRVGQAATKIGMDALNRFAIGGYSWAAARLTLDASGNLTVPGKITSNEFSGKNACTAWVNFNGSGTVVIRDSFNVSSITDSGVGQWVVNFNSAMSNANYSVVPNAGPADGLVLQSVYAPSDTMQTGSVKVRRAAGTGAAAADADTVCVHVFGGQN